MQIQIPAPYLPLLRRLAAICAPQEAQASLMGGSLRDALLNRPLHDLDLLVAGDGLEVARRIANALGGAFVPLDVVRRTGRAVLDPRQHLESGGASANQAPVQQLVVDVASLRAPTLEADLRLHDFTINALAAPLAPLATGATSLPLVDPCGGLHDLEARLLRVCSNQSFQDDPVRMLRAVRFAVKLNFTIDPGSTGLLRQAAPQIERVAAERVREELIQLLDHAGGAWGLRYLDEARLLTRIFPELEPARTCDQPRVHVLPVLAHSLEAVTAMEWLFGQLGVADHTMVAPAYAPQPLAVRHHPQLSLELPHRELLLQHLQQPLAVGHRRLALLKLATLLHDNAKPQTKEPKADGGVSFHGHQNIGAEIVTQIGRRLRLSRHEVAYLTTVVREHMRPGQLMQIDDLTLRAVSRFFRDCGDAGADVLLHSFADHMATRGPLLDPDGWRYHVAWVGALLGSQWDEPDEPAPLLDGRVLMRELALPSGPRIGQLLATVREAQLAGDVTTLEEALALARRSVEASSPERPGEQQ